MSERIRATLQSLYDQAVALASDGIETTEVRAGTLRTAVAERDGFFAAEFVGANAEGSWEAFRIQGPDGSIRVGWKIRASDPEARPPLWEALTLDLDVGEQVAPRSEPHFLSLVAAMASTRPPSVATADLELREDLALELAHYREVATRQAQEIRQLRLQLAAAQDGKPPGEAVIVPTPALTLDQLQSWADRHSDRIVILPRALAEARKSTYENPERVYAAFDFLAHSYPDLKCGGADWAKLKLRAAQIGIFVGGSVDPSRAGMQGEEYFVRYGGRSRFLDQHVGAGTSRDSRYAFRIYFFWDNDSQRVVVGHALSHLSNRFT